MVHYLTIIYTTLVTGMVYIEGNPHLDLLFQRALRYEQYLENFRESFSNKVTPSRLRIEKASPIVPVNEDFHIKWQKILKNAEKELIELTAVVRIRNNNSKDSV